MKNTIKLTLLAASLAFAGSASAVKKDIPDSGTLEATGYVPVVCGVEVGEGTLDFGDHIELNSRALFTGKINMTCNDKNGATIALSSANGGLADGDHVLDYNTWVRVNGLTNSSSDLADLVCNDGSCKPLDLVTGKKEDALAHGTSAVLGARIDQEVYYSGTYTDTITVSIAVNP